MRRKSHSRRGRNHQLENDDRRYLWHPFTQMKDWEKETPTIIARGKGPYLIDTDGHRYLDGVSSLWVNLHGHRKSKIDRAIAAQMGLIAHSTLLGLSNVPSIQLARELIQIAPKGLAKVFYSDDGSTAVEVALKLALQYWQYKSLINKRYILAFNNAYHGDTLGAIAVGGIELFHKRFAATTPPCRRLPYPYCYRCHLSLAYPSCEIACVREVEDFIKTHHHELAAVIIEPSVQAAAGMIVSPPGYLQRIRKTCTEYEVLLIADEVATGFGRTGKMFACEHDGITPDLMPIAKGLTGGYLPLAATLTTQAIYDAFLGEYAEFKTFFHGHSYTGNPLGCAAALANLEIFKKDRVLQKLQPKIRLIARHLESLRKLPSVGDIRQCGLMIGIELVRDPVSRDSFALTDRIGFRVAAAAKKRGMLIRPLGNVVVLMPPLSTSPDLLIRMVRIIRAAITEAMS